MMLTLTWLVQLYEARSPDLERKYARAINELKRSTRQDKLEETQDQALLLFAETTTGTALRTALLMEMFASKEAQNSVNKANYAALHNVLGLSNVKPPTTKDWAFITWITVVLLVVPAELLPRAYACRALFVRLVNENHTENTRRPSANDLVRVEILFQFDKDEKKKKDFKDVKQLLEQAMAFVGTPDAIDVAKAFLSAVETLLALWDNRNRSKRVKDLQASEAFVAMSEESKIAIGRLQYDSALTGLLTEALKSAGFSTECLITKSVITTTDQAVPGFRVLRSSGDTYMAAHNLPTEPHQAKPAEVATMRGRVVSELLDIALTTEPDIIVAAFPRPWPWRQKRSEKKKKKGGSENAKQKSKLLQTVDDDDEEEADEDEEDGDGPNWTDDKPTTWPAKDAAPSKDKIRGGESHRIDCVRHADKSHFMARVQH